MKSLIYIFILVLMIGCQKGDKVSTESSVKTDAAEKVVTEDCDSDKKEEEFIKKDEQKVDLLGGANTGCTL